MGEPARAVPRHQARRNADGRLGWDLERLALAAVLLHRTPVRSLAWDPSLAGAARLAISTADPLLHIWSTETADATITSCPLSMTRLQWRCDGSALLLQERDRVCVCSWGVPPGHVDVSAP